MRLRRRLALPLLAAPLLFTAALCSSGSDCKRCIDVVTTVPFSAGESHSYTLQRDNKDIGTTVLSVDAADGQLVLKEASSDDKGNSDVSTVTVDPATLKPISGHREVTDSHQRRVLESSYEATDKDCSSKIVVQLQQQNFKPPDADKADSTRSNPLCVPEHAYDNDSSLFLWRTIKFEKGYEASYKTVLTNRRTTQIIDLLVKDQVHISTPAGDFDAWLVNITAEASTQQAWYATTPDHRLLEYNNDGLIFLLTQ
jgi:hypothetical protein